MRKPALHARTRSGYYPDVQQKTALDTKTLAADLYEAAVSGIQYSGLSVHIASCNTHMSVALCHVKVDLANLNAQRIPNGDSNISVIAVSVVLDKRGKIVTYKAERITEKY